MRGWLLMLMQLTGGDVVHVVAEVGVIAYTQEGEDIASAASVVVVAAAMKAAAHSYEVDNAHDFLTPHQH